MTYTTPPTFSAGAILTAAQLNTYLRDNFKAIGDAWTSYTPAWTGSGGNPAIGNGTKAGAYVQVGKLTHFWIEITMGSTTTYGSGNWELDFPVAETAHRWNFVGEARDSSGAVTYAVSAGRTASDLMTVRCSPTTAGDNLRNVTPTVPFTWDTGDVLFVSGTYEAA